MTLNRSYYGLHQIIAGRYTPGNEYVLEDGSDYMGAYHVLPTGDLWTESRPRANSKKLYQKLFGVADSVKKYNHLRRAVSGNYMSPVPVQPLPNQDDYELGYIMRYFVQKRNNPINTILEIDNEQFFKINHDNKPGINGVLWNSVNIYWKISKLPVKDVSKVNQRYIRNTEKQFLYLSYFLRNPIEFYR